MKIVYGTSNSAKIQYMKEMLEELDIEIIGLKEIGVELEDVDESGNSPIENAKIKALAYYKVLKTPVFSCDTGLYIEGIEEEKQPGVHVRRVDGKTLNDEEMIEYYGGLATKHGGEVKARYKNAICLILDEENIFAYEEEDIASEEFYITDKIHRDRNKGFPLDSISIDAESGEYFIDRKSQGRWNRKMKKGFVDFFKRNFLE